MKQRSIPPRYIDIRQVAAGKFLTVLAVVGVLAGTAFAASVSLGQQVRDRARVSDIRTIERGLEVYQSRNKSFPLSLASLAPKYLSMLPKDPLGSMYLYNAYASTTSACAAGKTFGYHLGAALEGHATVEGDVNAPAQPLGTTICAGGSSKVGFNGASNKCVQASFPEGGDNCFDVREMSGN